MWSEHCSYKSSRVHLKKFPTTGPRVIQGPGENAGVVDIGDGLAVVLQDGVAQPPVLHRALPGRGDGRRRHPARRLHDGRAADGVVELAALRAARRAADEAPRRRRRARHRRLRQLHRHPDGRRRDDVRQGLRRQHPRQRHERRHRPHRPHLPRPRRGRGQSDRLRRLEDRAATASTARRWPPRSSPPTKRSRSARPCRSAIPSPRSCSWRRASSSSRRTPSSASRTWAPRG